MLPNLTNLIAHKERPRFWFMAGLFFLFMAGMAIGLSARDAFFIDVAGVENRPYVYILNGVLIMIFSPLFVIFTNRISLFRSMVTLSILFSVLVFAIRLMIMAPYHEGFFSLKPYLAYVLTELYTLMILIYYWTFANTVFDPRESKRLFPLIGAAGLLGSMFGSLSIVWLLPIIGGNANLFLVWGAILVLCVPLLFRIKRVTTESGIILARREGDPGIIGGISKLWELDIIHNLAYLTIPMWLVAWLVDYQFFVFLEEALLKGNLDIFFDSERNAQDKLAGFLGPFYSLTYLGGVFLEFFIVGKVLQKFGIRVAILIHPVTMAFASLGLIVRNFTTIPKIKAFFGMTAKYLDETLLNSAGESATHLLFNSIQENLRGSSRAFLIGVVEPVASILVGCFLLVFIKMPHGFLAYITFSLTLVWIYFAVKVGKSYVKSMVNQLNSRNEELYKTAFDEISKTKDIGSSKFLGSMIKGDDEGVALLTLDYLRKSLDLTKCRLLYTFLPEITRVAVKTKILNLLGDFKEHIDLEAIKPFLTDPQASVRAASIRAWGKLSKDVRILKKHLKENNLTIVREVIISTLRHQKSLQPNDASVLALKRLLNARDHHKKRHALQCLQELSRKEFAPQLYSLLKHKDVDIVNKTIQAIGNLKQESAIAKIIPYLVQNQYKLSAHKALTHLGQMAIEPLLIYLKKEKKMETKKEIILCLGELGNEKSIPILQQLLTNQHIVIEDACIQALAEIKRSLVDKGMPISKYKEKYLPEQMLSVLMGALRSMVSQFQNQQKLIHYFKKIKNVKASLLLIDALVKDNKRLEGRALHCLEVLYDPRPIQSIALELHGMEKRSRSEALETLEESIPEAKVLVKALERKHGQDEGPLYANYEEALRVVLGGRHRSWIYACGLYMAGELQLKKLERELTDLSKFKDRWISLNAYVAAKKCKIRIPKNVSGKEVQAMNKEMERLLFLRSVPLFSDVDGSDLQWVNEITREFSVKKNHVIFKEYDPGDTLYIIKTGSVRVYKENKNFSKQKVNLSILEERDCFGEMAILDREPRSATVQALKNTSLLVIHRMDFQHLVISHPRISFALFKTMSRRLRNTQSQLLEIQK